ncbi:hypothetical protein ACROYT_G001875 [Oculina patagonica]
MRRFINVAQLNDSRGEGNSSLSHPSMVNGTKNVLDNVTSTVTPQTSTPTLQVPALRDEDSKITMHCKSYWFSCRGRCTQEREMGGTKERLQCFCDNSCEFFGDCCADFDQYCSSSGISPQDVKNLDQNDLWRCVSHHRSFIKAGGLWMISSCPKKWAQVDIKERCRQDIIPSYDNLKDVVPVIDPKGNTYKNYYCAQCHGFNVKDVRCGPGPYPYGSDGTLAKPFSLVMDIDFSDQDQHREEAPKVLGLKVSCPFLVYDFYLEVCRPGIAPSDVTPTSLRVREKVFIVSVWMRSIVWTLHRPLITKVNFEEAIANKLNINKTLISNIFIRNPFGPVSTVVFNIHINPAIQKNVSTQSLQTALSFLSIIVNYGVKFTIFKAAVKPFNCAIVNTFHPNEYTFEGNAVKIRNSGEIIQKADYYTNETEWKNGSLVPIGILTVCKQPQLNCSGVLIGLNESEYVILSNGSLFRNISREFFPPGSFLFINDTTWVCTQFSSNYEAPSAADEISSDIENPVLDREPKTTTSLDGTEQFLGNTPASTTPS